MIIYFLLWDIPIKITKGIAMIIPEILLSADSTNIVLNFCLSFIAGAQKCNQQPIFDLYYSKFLPHFKFTMSRNRLLLLVKFCRFNDADTRNDGRDDRFGHIREYW